MKKIGILGGTFNPIHNGHIELGKKAIKDFSLDQVIFIPTGMPPHKSKKDIAPKKHRLKMVQLAIAGTNKFKISKTEINRKGYSYAIDTFGRLQRRFGKKSQLFYIMGLDSVSSILSWKRPIELFRFCKFIVATRPGSKVRTLKRLLKFPPLAINKDKIMMMELNMDMSSTDIRHKIKSQRPVASLVQKDVLQYIDDKGLYK
jgi:nicotinate-nucleotide adenylyltransferase